MAESILRFANVGKSYGSNQVLKGINMDVRPGEIHALIGENGAGKSTLMNILFGMPVIHDTGGFEGTVEIDGEDAHIMTPHDAMEKGIGMVHQEFMLTRLYHNRKHKTQPRNHQADCAFKDIWQASAGTGNGQDECRRSQGFGYHGDGY